MHPGAPLYLPVILGTTRKGRLSEHVARLVADVVAMQPGVSTELVDIAQLPLPADDAGEAIRDCEFAEKMERADGLVVVTPEYNHSFPGLLKHALDSCLEQYIHKPVGLVGVAAGPFGGARCIQNFLPVLRELGLVTIFSDVYFGSVHELFDDTGRLRDEAYVRRTRDFLDELVWMATTLRWGRHNVGVEGEGAEAEPLTCVVCGAAMNHHANKPVDPRSPEQAAAGLVTLAAHTCSACGHSATLATR